MKLHLPLLSILAFGLLTVLAPLNQAAQEPAAPEVEVLFSSSLWTKVDNAVSGTYRIEQRTQQTEEGPKTQRFLVLGEDFSTKAGPDLKVVLSPTEHDEVKGKTALRGSTILAPLDTNSGSSEYQLPRDLDLGDVRSVLIHCEAYTKLWAASPLEAGRVLASGTDWTKKSNKVKGAWELALRGDQLELRLGRDYKTKKGPDLKFILSPHSTSEASGDNATQRGLILSPLATHKGAQRFSVQLPQDFDLSNYGALLLHCEEYSKLWAASPI